MTTGDFAVAFGYRYGSNKPEQIRVINSNTLEIRVYNSLDIALLKNKLENFGISNNLEIIPMAGDITKYTNYIINGQTINKGITILKRELYRDRLMHYTLTDGVSNPINLTLKELYDYSKYSGIGIANANIHKGNRGVSISGIGSSHTIFND